jgi:serine protease Do
VHRAIRILSIISLAIFSGWAQVQAQPTETLTKANPAVSLRELSDSFQQLSARVRMSVVQIFSTGYTAPEEEDSTNTALLTKQKSIGSGVIVSADGYIVTNSHVVRGARRIEVRLPERRGPNGRVVIQPGGRMLIAKLIGMDRESDLAVIKIERAGLPYLPFGNSRNVHQGQIVMAFGNPLGLEGSVSMGIVSSTERQIKLDDAMIYIQTDTAINPGNSGGPLVDTDGRVIGINTFILSQSGGSEGIGFAIPGDLVHSVYDQIRKEGHVHRGQIGLFAQTVSPALATGLSLPQDWGVVVGDVDPDGPADKAGIKVGDIVTALNGRSISNARQLEINVYRVPTGQKVTLELLRGSEKLTVEVPVVDQPRDPERFADMVSPEANLVQRLGVLCIPIDKKLAAMLPDLRNAYGLVVAAGSTRDLTTGGQLQPGDVIYSVNGDPVTSVPAFRKKLDEFKSGDSPVFQIERSSRLMFVTIELE